MCEKELAILAIQLHYELIISILGLEVAAKDVIKKKNQT